MSIRKTKIICTLGPASETEEVIRELMLAGMNVARLNFSHGTYDEQRGKIDLVKKVRAELGLPVALLLDTKGPEIRTRDVEGGRIELKKGQSFILTTEDILGSERKVSITYQDLVKDVEPGDAILIDDGLIELKVNQVTEKDIICTVKNGGVVSNKKGINVPGVNLNMPFVSQKDYEDILFGIEEGFDFIAASFTRSPEDILEIRKILDEKNCHHIKIIAKIENLQGVERIDEIMRVSDGIMIARGDMGVEIPLEEVPGIQKKLIQKSFETGKPVITATQMLDSMMKNPRPTRAETTDVANAIYQGTSAIMLSGETASGQYPVEALKTMVRIAIRTEEDIDYDARFKHRTIKDNPDITNAVSHATCTTAVDLQAAAIITVTKSGRTVGMPSHSGLLRWPHDRIYIVCLRSHTGSSGMASLIPRLAGQSVSWPHCRGKSLDTLLFVLLISSIKIPYQAHEKPLSHRGFYGVIFFNTALRANRWREAQSHPKSLGCSPSRASWRRR